jgi:hypothetical protein
MIKYKKTCGLRHADLSAEQLKNAGAIMIAHNGNSRRVSLHWNHIEKQYQVTFSDSEQTPQVFDRKEFRASILEAKRLFERRCADIATWHSVEGFYNGKWESVTWEPTLEQARATRKLYSESEPGTSFMTKPVKWIEPQEEATDGS